MTPHTYAAPAATEQWLTVGCPACGVPAEVEWQAQVASTAGPVGHAKIRCAVGHWFLMPAEQLDFG
jgi:hypothetical protein